MTTTPRYRIGNDMTILWAINNKDGSPFDMSGKEVHLFVTHRYGREEVQCSVVTLPDGTVNNVIRWDFSGDDQKVLGNYALTASIYTSDDLKLIRKDICEAFELVGASCMECEEDGEAVINDGGDLILSSKLDIYRFGIPKIYIGTNGNWHIDGVDTGKSAIGGGPGLVTNIYKSSDFGQTFDEESVIDTFNAHAVNELARRISILEGDDYYQIKNLTDVSLTGNLLVGQALVWDGTHWTNQIVATKSTPGEVPDDYEDRLAAVEKLLDWFSFDEEVRQIKANYGLYTFGGLTAAGRGQLGGVGLGDLKDISISDIKDGQALVYDAASGFWKNKKVSAGGGSAEVTYQSVIDALGYTPFNSAQFTKANIKSTLGISDWALAASKPSYTKGEVGLGNVDNIAASGYLTALSSNGTNAVSITVGGTTKSITVATMKSSLGLGSLAYKSSLAFSELTGKPTTLDGFGITKADIISKIGISDWALAASKPSYSWSEINSRPTTLSQFTNDLDLGALAYKGTLAFSELTGKPTTLAGYGITDAVAYKHRIDPIADYRDIGYCYYYDTDGIPTGWFGTGPALTFGAKGYSLRMQLLIERDDTPRLMVSQVYDSTAYGWAEIVTYEGNINRYFYAAAYFIGDSFALHRNGTDTFLNYGNRTAGDLYLYGKNLRFTADGGSTYPFRILNDNSVLIHGVGLSSGTSGALKAGAYEAQQYFSDGKLIAHRNPGYAGTYVNYGGRAETLFLCGTTFSFLSGESATTVLTINNGNAEFYKNCKIDGTLTTDTIYGDTPSGASYPRYRVFSHPNGLFFQAATYDGTSHDGNIGFTGIGGNAANDIYFQAKSIRLLSQGIRFYVADGATEAWRILEDGRTYIFKDFLLSGAALRISTSGSDAMVYAQNTDTLNQLSFGVSSGGYNRGIYDNGVGAWWIRRGDDTNTYIGGASGSAMMPVLNSAQNLGTNNYRWASLYTKIADVKDSIKIGDAVISWDADAGMLKADKGLYSTGAITAGGQGTGGAGINGPAAIDLSVFMDSTSLTDAQVASAGLTAEVIDNLIAGKYTKVIFERAGRREVWNYSAYSTSSSIDLYFNQGDGFYAMTGIYLNTSKNGTWSIEYGEI